MLLLGINKAEAEFNQNGNKRLNGNTDIRSSKQELSLVEVSFVLSLVEVRN